MESFMQHWQSVTECTIPRMAHQSIHGALWWSIDRISAIYFRSFNTVPPKLETKKSGPVNYAVQNKFLPRI